MGKSKRPARSPLKVTVMFEGDRFTSEYLATAYEQLIPLNARTIFLKKKAKLDVAFTPMRRQES